MIEKIEFNDISSSELFSYIDKLDFFKQNKSVHFKPGLNILFSPNGTGKSSLLKMIALSLAAEQGGVSTVTNSWRMELHTFSDKDKTKMNGIEVFHDGQPILYGNPRNAVGLIGGSFDDDFMIEGIHNCQSKISTGLTTINRLNQILNILTANGKMPEQMAYKIPKERIPESIADLLNAKIPQGQKTILMDEPESGLAMHVQANIFSIINKAAKEKDLQIIIATHSPFAFITQANFIELIPGHIETSKNALKHLQIFL